MTGSRDTSALQSLAGSAWLADLDLRRVLAAIGPEGGGARVVGGAVRNALLGEPITDVDIATPVKPDEVMRRAAAAGLGVHPTGIDHGTVTVVSGGHAFEVTTLRRDVETDGRRAVVAFSDDWREDALRRDFTMNALYATGDGTVHDYFGGLQDLRRRHVRFIGDATERIREDYLRILRFFRFNAQYGLGALDAGGLAACVALKDGLVRLSAERIGAELMKLMAAPRAAEIVAIMDQVGILRMVLGQPLYPQRLARVVAIEAANGLTPDRWTRLCALALDAPQSASHLGERLRLSKSEVEALAGAAARHGSFDPAASEDEARAHLYRTGVANYYRAALVDWASGTDGVENVARAARLRLPERWPVPTLPVRGTDVMALGIPSGPQVGKILAAFEAWWIDQDFPQDTAAVHAQLRALANKGY